MRIGSSSNPKHNIKYHSPSINRCEPNDRRKVRTEKTKRKTKETGEK